ncbi:MAG: hypothetical protein KGO49_00715 [Gammaproteobacteria bacterium]|nr:hypothetical protein [Gammaproteobacteria bacterium]
MTSPNLATLESYPRIELADKLLGDRLAIRSEALSTLADNIPIYALDGRAVRILSFVD